jgi:hypothetical protein
MAQRELILPFVSLVPLRDATQKSLLKNSLISKVKHTQTYFVD